jgi:hypothetical protein
LKGENTERRTMTTPHLHVFAIDGTADIWHQHESAGAGWVCLTVPRLSIFGKQTPEITEWDYGIWHGSQAAMATCIARKAVEIQGLDYKTGPAIVLDDTAVRINAMVELLRHQGRTGDGIVYFQPREAIKPITDDTLRAQHIYVAHPNISTAIKHALACLRRARRNAAFAHEMWPYPASGRP